MRIKIQVLPTDTVAQLVERRRDMPKDLGSNPSECHIFFMFSCALSFSATLAKRWKVQFRLGLAKTLNNIDSNNGIQISKKEYYTIYIWTSTEKISANWIITFNRNKE